MKGIVTVSAFWLFFFFKLWEYDGYCNGLKVFGPETVEIVDYHKIYLKKYKKYAKTVGFYRHKSESVSESFVSLCKSKVDFFKKNEAEKCHGPW